MMSKRRLVLALGALTLMAAALPGTASAGVWIEEIWIAVPPADPTLVWSNDDPVDPYEKVVVQPGDDLSVTVVAHFDNSSTPPLKWGSTKIVFEGHEFCLKNSELHSKTSGIAQEIFTITVPDDACFYPAMKVALYDSFNTSCSGNATGWAEVPWDMLEVNPQQTGHCVPDLSINGCLNAPFWNPTERTITGLEVFNFTEPEPTCGSIPYVVSAKRWDGTAWVEPATFGCEDVSETPHDVLLTVRYWDGDGPLPFYMYCQTKVLIEDCTDPDIKCRYVDNQRVAVDADCKATLPDFSQIPVWVSYMEQVRWRSKVAVNKVW